MMAEGDAQVIADGCAVLSKPPVTPVERQPPAADLSAAGT
jgi:hypothetical protein